MEQGTYTFSGVKVSINSAVGACTSYSSIEELVKGLGKHNPYVIHVVGFGVLTRLIDFVPNFKESLIVAGNQDEFLFNSYETQGKLSVSFIRKSLLSSIFEELEKLKVFLFGIHIGPIPLLGMHINHFAWKGEFDILVENEKILKLEKGTNTETIENKVLKSVSFEPYFSQSDHYVQALEIEALQIASQNYKEYKRFVFLGVGILAFFLITLIGNYFYVGNLNQKVAEMETQISSFGENLSLIAGMNEEKTRKSILIDNSGLQTKRLISFYLDKVGETVPERIQLLKMEVFPLMEPLKPKRKVDVDHSKIEIVGETLSSKILDDWMETMEDFEWVKGVELINYYKENEQSSTFQISIKINQ